MGSQGHPGMSTPGRGQGQSGYGDQGQTGGQDVIHGLMGPDGEIFLPEGHGLCLKFKDSSHCLDQIFQLSLSNI